MWAHPYIRAPSNVLVSVFQFYLLLLPPPTSRLIVVKLRRLLAPCMVGISRVGTLKYALLPVAAL